jgi:hypothetical protein
MAAVQQLLTKEERGNGGPARCAARWRRKRGPGCAAGAGGGKNPGAAARQRGSRGRRRGGVSGTIEEAGLGHWAVVD